MVEEVGPEIEGIFSSVLNHAMQNHVKNLEQ
jgi:hypothetical protein